MSRQSSNGNFQGLKQTVPPRSVVGLDHHHHDQIIMRRPNFHRMETIKEEDTGNTDMENIKRISNCQIHSN